MSIFGKIKGAFGGGHGAAPQRVAGPAVQRSGYMRGGGGVLFGRWRPALREPQHAVSDAWDAATSRAMDAILNSGWLSGAIEQSIANTVGRGLRLKVQPENALFGMAEADARAWGRMVEQRFEIWSRAPQECDIEGVRTFGQMQAAAYRSFLATGEVLAELPWRRRPWGQNGTKVRLLPAHRLARASSSADRIVNGVKLDRDGMPVGYLVSANPHFGGLHRDRLVRARDSAGRPRVIHIFDGPPGTYRGITPLAPILQVTRQFDQLADATLTATILQTLFAATIESDLPTEEAMAGILTPQEQARLASQGVSAAEAYMQMVGGFYEEAPVDLGANGRIGHLFPGQELKFQTAQGSATDYVGFSRQLLREIARCLGMTYEGATGDYTGATYSSTRMATGEIFEVTQMRRAHVVAPFCQAAYAAWLEEEIEAERIPFPGGINAFLANRTAASRADWRGSPKLQADDVKTARAHEVWRRLGVVSDAMIAADLGVDIEDVFVERKAERELREAYGLPEPAQMGEFGGGPQGGARDGEETEDERRDDRD